MMQPFAPFLLYEQETLACIAVTLEAAAEFLTSASLTKSAQAEKCHCLIQK